jgi:hypothetical protein
VVLPRKSLTLLRARDPHCWHCGTPDDLVPHHRKNRGLGGSKLLDGLDNLMLVCAFYNGEMESTSQVAIQARGYGHKLARWEATDKPVFDCPTFTWYMLGEDGARVVVNIGEHF